MLLNMKANADRMSHKCLIICFLQNSFNFTFYLTKNSSEGINTEI